MKKIAVLTSGGDSPGMNACLRAIVLTAQQLSYQVIGFEHGYNGLIDNEFISLDYPSVQHIIAQGGTLLKSARCEKFKTEKGIKQAVANLHNHDIDALIIIGGDGSIRGMMTLEQHWNGQLIAVPGTIDNDLSGSDNTIGYYTAVETVMAAIDKIRDTADAFERLFLIEVMGRHSGFIALSSAIASAAEQAIYPEIIDNSHGELNTIIGHIEASRKLHGKASYIMVICENLWPGGAQDLADTLTKQIGIECQACILGHIQRGGAPCAYDRILATKLGAFAVECIQNEQHGVMVGEQSNQLTFTPAQTCVDERKRLDPYLQHIHLKLFDSIENWQHDQ